MLILLDNHHVASGALALSPTAPVFRPSDNGWTCKAPLPGLSAKDVSVEVADGIEKLLWIKTPRFVKEYRCECTAALTERSAHRLRRRARSPAPRLLHRCPCAASALSWRARSNERGRGHGGMTFQRLSLCFRRLLFRPAFPI